MSPVKDECFHPSALHPIMIDPLGLTLDPAAQEMMWKVKKPTPLPEPGL
jgi:hypothetical protein